MRRNQLFRGAALLLLLVALAIGSSTVLAATTVAGTWTAVNPGSNASEVALATAADGTVGMAYRRGNAIYFRSFNGAWSGESTIFSGSFPAYEPSIAYSGNIPYVSWSQQVNANSSRPYVAVGTASTGGTWSGLGGSTTGNGLCPFCVDNAGLGIFWNTESSDIAIDPVTGQPALAYNAYDTSFSNGDVYYVRWNGSAWVRDTGAALSTLTLNDGISRPAQNTLLGMYPSLSFNSAGTPFIAYGEYISGPPDVYNPLVRVLIGGTWSAPFNLHNTAPLLPRVEIAFSGATAMAVWADSSGGAYFRTFNGATWSGVGTITGATDATRVELTSTPFGFLVALNRGGGVGAGRITAKIYNGTDWDDLSTGALVEANVEPDRVPAIAVSGNYVPVVAYITAGTGSVPLGAETFAPTGLTTAINDVTVTEGNSGTIAAGFTVTRSGSIWPARVTFTTANGSTNPALGGTDYVTATGTVTFGYAGTNTQPVSVTVNGDTLYERNETYFVDLTAPSNGVTFTDAQGLGTITNDDPPPVISIGTPSAITEGTGAGTTTLVFPLSLNTASGVDATVTVNTTAGTATAADFTPIAGGTATIAAGSISGAINVTITRDALDEADTEDFTVTISAPVDATLGTTTATGTINDDDPPPTLTITDVTLAEGNAGTTPFSFVVGLNAPSGRTVTVNYTTTNGTATAGTDYTSATGTVTFVPGDISETVVIDVNGDPTFETNETFTVDLSGGANYTAAGSDLSGLGTITNDDAPPVISIGTPSAITEGTGAGTTTLTFPLSLDVISSLDATVTVNTTAGSATATDFTPIVNGTATIAAGSLTGSIDVTITRDALDEEDTETFTVTLSVPVNATLGTTTATGTITDDDDPPTFSIDDATINPEGNGGGTTNAVFTVDLSAASGRTITINYATSAGTASAGQDYTTTTGTLTFLPGDTRETISVPVVQDDRDDEDNETFTVLLSGATNAASTGNDADGLGTIVDDDATPTLNITDVTLAEGNAGTTPFTFTVTLSAPSNRTVTVNYTTTNGTASAGTDYVSATGTLTFLPGDDSESVAIDVNGDPTFETTETFTVDLSGGANYTAAGSVLSGLGTITNDDTQPTLAINDISVTEGNSGPANLVFTVTRTGTSSLPITVDYATANNTAAAGTDYTATSGTLTFNPGDPATQTVTVVVTGDVVDEIDETLFVNLSNASNATILDAQGIGTITDDDTTGITIDDVDVLETDVGTDTALVFTVALSNPNSRVVTVEYDTAPGVVFPATAGTDYTTSTGTLTVNPGDALMQMITVPVLGDNSDEPNETLLVNLSNVSASAVITDDLGVGTILDNDGPPTLNIDSVTLAEGNAGPTNFVFTASLTAPSAFPVTFDYTTADNTASAGTDYTTTAATGVTIAAGDTDFTITVPVSGDTVYELTETFFVQLSNLNGADAGVMQGTGTITNDDPLPVVSINNVTINEGNSGTTPFSFDVTLNTPSARDVIVTVTSANGTTNPATAGSDYTALAAGTTVTIPAGSTGPVPVTVNVNGDTLYERDETFTVALSSPVDATIGTGTGTGTITNDDTAPGLSIIDGILLEGTGGTTTASRFITLDAVSGVDVVVTYDTADGTATAPADYTAVTAQTVTIPAGDPELLITIPVVPDAIDENNETFTITLSSPVDASITTGTATITIQDDDTVGFTVNPLDASTSESGTSDTFTVVLTSQPLTDVVITLASADTAEVTVNPASLTFTPGNWDQPQTVMVTGGDDDVIDGDQLVNVTVAIDDAASADAFDLLPDQTVAVTNADDDSAGIVLLRPGGALVIAEGGTTGSIGVNLTSEPAADVTITFTPDAQCELDTGAGFGGAGVVRSLTFTAANWDTLTPVLVRAIDDLLFEGPHACAITVGTPTSTDANYNGAAPAITLDGSAFTAPGLITASVTDNDVASATPTNTPTATATATLTPTPTSTGTITATFTPTSTGTITATPDGTLTPTPSATPPAVAATEVPVIGTFTLVDGRTVINDGRTITITNPDGTTQTIVSGRVTLANNQLTVFDNTGRPVVDLVTVAAQSLGTVGSIPPTGISQFVTLTGTGIAGRGTTTVANIVVTNTSSTTLNNAVLTINAGGLGLSFGSGAFNPLEQLIAVLTGASAADAQSAELRWAIGTLAPGQSVSRAVTITIPASFTGNSFVLTTTLAADGLTPETDTVFYSVASGLPATGEALGLPPLLLIAALGGIALLAAMTLIRRRGA